MTAVTVRETRSRRFELSPARAVETSEEIGAGTPRWARKFWTWVSTSRLSTPFITASVTLSSSAAVMAGSVASGATAST